MRACISPQPTYSYLPTAHQHDPHTNTHKHREVAALRTLSQSDALRLWDQSIAVSAPKRRKLAVYVFSRNHADSKLVQGGKDGEKGVVLVETMEELRKLKRGLALYGAPGPVVKEESLLAGSAAIDAPAPAPDSVAAAAS